MALDGMSILPGSSVQHGSTVVAALASADRLASGALLYVEQRGAFELLRREVWPGGRVLLTLAAWPRR
jgi:hypothetical protein